MGTPVGEEYASHSVVIDAQYCGNEFSRMNNSTNPNVAIHIALIDDYAIPVVVALHDIIIETELTIIYGSLTYGSMM